MKELVAEHIDTWVYATDEGLLLHTCTDDWCKFSDHTIPWYDLAEYLPSDLMHNELLDRMRKERLE